ncbi:GH32 C-terminal domain-containing protein [Parabacteroides sp. FAFU027]|uniref:GH32 C-terminal domain-containing protein n=1 Tax=Parabacteroides sp. FAFU027 TaxID=2922715 RepID=UPI001FAFBE46|nr:GH32 C-terminal domain-containing protein [Parabacteroides sp. FAFU027]
MKKIQFTQYGCIFAFLQLIAAMVTVSANATTPVALFPMELSGNSIQEIIANKTFVVSSNLAPESVLGAEGNAVRFDGYSTIVTAEINAAALNNQSLSFSLWCAMETYPMMNTDVQTSTATYIAGNMREDLKTGFAFTLNNTGRYGFEVYLSGTKYTCYDNYLKLPKYQWGHLTATVSIADHQILLYNNGELVGRTSFSASQINVGENTFMIGKSFTDDRAGIFRTNTINGIVDNMKIYSSVLAPTEIGYHVPENTADLSIPKSRHSNDIQRPSFHGQPATNWTNEPHGLVFYNNKYHLFFQKNANGPYMGRLHWGHISSDDLINWREEKIAIAPAETYDQKGTWSGCVFTDNVLTDGKPNIFYTGVDYAKASIDRAIPSDNDLIAWTKDVLNPLVPNKPAGLSDDFRDPYVFKSNNEFYMIVGTSKNGKGAATLQKYNQLTKSWSNDGTIFYQSISTDYGTFWEMPLIEPMGNGKWIFMSTVLGGINGVETLYWVGTINSDGTFNPISNVPKEVELGTMGRDGYGLLSPSVTHKDGKMIAIGIVPDKLPSQNNLQLGWAHLYSLPREWSLSNDNFLIQKPYSGLEKMRDMTSAFQLTDTEVSGTIAMPSVAGKSLEIKSTFIVSSATRFGFNVRKSGSNGIAIYYTPSTNKITVDAQSIARLSNDAGVFNGLYESTLPQQMAQGDTLTLQIFVDHSVMDIFVNKKYAFSLRVFPTDTNAEQVEVFSDGGSTKAVLVEAWKLNPTLSNPNAVVTVSQDNFIIYVNRETLIYRNIPSHSIISVNDLLGRIVAVKDIGEETSGEIRLPEKQVYLVKVSGHNFSAVKKIISA